MARYRYVVDEDALVALLALQDWSIALLLPHIEAIVEQPSAGVNYFSYDAYDRRLANKIAGDFLISYWSDDAARTVHILRIDRRAPDNLST
jgi:hypothetical protein